jgi:hypothetical protein
MQKQTCSTNQRLLSQVHGVHWYEYHTRWGYHISIRICTRSCSETWPLCFYLHTVRLSCDFAEESRHMRSGYALKPHVRIHYVRYFYIANHSYQPDRSSHLSNHWRSIVTSSIRLKSNQSTDRCAPPHPSPRKHHQPRIQHHRQQQMTPRHSRQRQNRHKIPNMPIIRHPAIPAQTPKTPSPQIQPARRTC